MPTYRTVALNQLPPGLQDVIVKNGINEKIAFIRLSNDGDGYIHFKSTSQLTEQNIHHLRESKWLTMFSHDFIAFSSNEERNKKLTFFDKIVDFTQSIFRKIKI